jgi:CRISPR/Cas system CMR subunit Cmr4 (Cas7 group RAMP superfamily)
VKLTDVNYQDPKDLPLPSELQDYKERLLIVPDEAISIFVDMGLVRQPRVSLSDEPDDKGSLVKNLFAVEGIPPGAAFFFAWSSRKDVQHIPQWQAFLHQEHHLGGLWSVGYGRVVIEQV